jgi:hypothetical protein
MEIFQLLCSRRYCPANVSQLNCQLNYSAIYFQPPLQNSTLNWLGQSQSHIATDGLSISKSWCRAPSGTHDQIFITLWQLRFCFYGAPSLTRGRVCLLYILLALASVVFLGSESQTVSDFRLPFSSPPMTRRITVEVLVPASTRVWLGRPSCFPYNHSARTEYKILFGTVPLVFCAYSLRRERVYRTVA